MANKVLEKIDFGSIKSELIDNVQNVVTDEAKKYFTKWLKESGMPQIKEVVDVYTAKLKEDASKEQGWCKIRDGFLLPTVILFSFTVLNNLLSKVVEETK